MQGVTKITVTKKYNGRVDEETIQGPITDEGLHKLMIDNLKDKDAIEIDFGLSFGEPTTTTLTREQADKLLSDELDFDVEGVFDPEEGE